jgi:hypothetical protein
MEVEAKTGRGQTQWTLTQSTFMHTFLANLVADGTKTSTGFKKVHLNMYAKALNDHFKLNKSTDQIANHLKTLRKKYSRINQLRNLSVALWNEDLFIISLNHEHYTNHFEVKYCHCLYFITCIAADLYILIGLFIDRLQRIRVMMSP